MIERWTTAVLDTDLPGGWAVARGPDGFLYDDNGALFPRHWLKGQDCRCWRNTASAISMASRCTCWN